MKTRDRARQMATAYHEAGHAVAAFYLHMPVYTATIKFDKESGSRGHVLHHNPLKRASHEDIYELTPKARDRIERLIMVALAGGVAQRRYNPHSYRHVHTSADHDNAVDLANRIAGDGKGATLLLRYLAHRTKGLVGARWPEIKCVAEELLANTTLRAGDVRTVINAYYDKRVKTT